jgi:hypothetical protein
MTSRMIVLIGLIGLVSACDKTINNYPTAPSQLPSTNPPNPQVITSKIEFRVTGNANSVRVKYFTPLDGLIQAVTTLPFTTSFTTVQDELFLSLDVTPISYSASVTFPFLSAQIFVNGNLFREVTSTDIFLNTLSISGNWRR